MAEFKALAIQVSAGQDPAVKIMTETALDIDTRTLSLRTAMIALAEEARSAVPGGDIEIRATIYDDGFVKVAVHQGFVPV